jgi:hypothetical protein
MSELTWTTEKFSKAGWYWWRENGNQSDSIVVKVYPQDDCVAPGPTDA